MKQLAYWTYAWIGIGINIPNAASHEFSSKVALFLVWPIVIGYNLAVLKVPH